MTDPNAGVHLGLANYLCICQYGHSRSVALARRLHHRKLTAIAIGYRTAGLAGLGVLTTWADFILLADLNARSSIAPAHHYKLRNFDVGPDRWSNPYNHELLKIMEDKLVKEFGFEPQPV